MDWLWTAEKIHVRKVFFFKILDLLVGDPIRPRCWTCAIRTDTAQTSRHERRSDESWRHPLQAIYGHSGRFSFCFTIRTADADRIRQRNFITWRGPEQHATRKARQALGQRPQSFLGWRRRMEVAVRRGSEVFAGTMC